MGEGVEAEPEIDGIGLPPQKHSGVNMAYSMQVFVKFQEKDEEPLEKVGISNPHKIASADGEYIPLPNVGDVIDCKHVGGHAFPPNSPTAKYRVRARYLTYTEGQCTVFLIVTDLEEPALRSRGRRGSLRILATLPKILKPTLRTPST